MRGKRVRGRASKVLIPLVVVFINASIILFPREALAAARGGLSLWLDNVLPALLPFAVGINILGALGFTRFLGVLLEPLMRPLFRVPGVGGFALITGLMSGSPLGAKVTAALRKDGLISAAEARRLVGFTNNCGPLFIIGAVGVGLFGDAATGYFIFVVHMLAALAVGLVFRCFGTDKVERIKKGLLTRACAEMREGRAKTGFGGILATSVTDAMETMLLVGGFIILFAVIIGIGQAMGLFAALAGFFNAEQLVAGAATGFLEITAGARDLAGVGGRGALIAAAAVISWGGLCIHAQSLGFISKTDIGAAPYILGKSLHATFAAALAFLLYPVYTTLSPQTAQTALFNNQAPPSPLDHAINSLTSSAALFAASMTALTLLAFALYWLRRAR